MIDISKINKSEPYSLIQELYEKALGKNQKNIEALLIASFDKDFNEVDSRFVNLKFIDDINFIFFSNYESPKSKQFNSHNQISAILYWSSIDVQIRMKAYISKCSKHFSDEYFKNRSPDKNALAISSSQSQKIESYEKIEKKYINIKNNADLKHRPSHWGGFTFTPYLIEIWEGHSYRLNKRRMYEKKDGSWIKNFLEP